MDLNYSQEESAFRDEVRGWLKANLPQDLRDKMANHAHLSKDDLLRWHKILAKKGWVAPAWPKEWGGTGWNVVQRYLFEEELGFAGSPPLIPFGLTMCAPVLLRFGSEAQKKRFLPRIYNGEDFCARLRVALAPEILPVVDAGQEPLLLGLGAEAQQHRRAHPHSERHDHRGGREAALLLEDVPLDHVPVRPAP